jgi:hypothetical protein
MYQFVTIEKLACIRRRLATEADLVMTAALTRLWERETEKSAVAIQKELDDRDA